MDLGRKTAWGVLGGAFIAAVALAQPHGAEYLSNDPAHVGGAPLTEAAPDLGVTIHIEDPTGHALDAFHASLRAAATGGKKARILFFGASHVASDLYTGRVRELLQTAYGDGGPGFVLPVRPWRYYANRGFTFDGTPRRWTTGRVLVTTAEEDAYGLAGTYVESSKAGAWGAITTTASGAVGGRAADYDVYFWKHPGGGDFEVSIDGERRGRVRTKADVATSGYATFQVPDGPHRFEVRVVGNGPVRLFGVAVERGEGGVVVDTLGINGARARTQLLWNEEVFREQVARRVPSLLVLAYGTNESGDTDEPIGVYERDLRDVVRRARDAAPASSCLLIGPSDRPVVERHVISPRPRTEEIVAVQRRVAAEAGCGFFDLVAFMGGPLSMPRWVTHDPPFAQPDHIHLNARGYGRLAEVLTTALLAGYGGSPQGGGSVRPSPTENP